MKCYYHPERDAVSTCSDCGKGLCKECTDKYDIIICDACNEKRKVIDERENSQRITEQNENIKAFLFNEIIKALIFFLYGFVLAIVLSFIMDYGGLFIESNLFFIPVIIAPYALRLIILLFPPVGCFTWLLEIWLSIQLSPIAFLIGTILTVRKTIKMERDLLSGIMSALLYVGVLLIISYTAYYFFIEVRARIAAAM